MKKKGAALLVVIIIMMLTFLLAAIMFENSIKHLRVSNDTVENTKAYYCAEAGIYDAINYIQLMAGAGAFNSSYYGYNIPISNLYSEGENSGGTDYYLFGDSNAFYTASIELKSIESGTTLTEKKYKCEIKSKGTYNNQNHLINNEVKIYYEGGRWTYTFTRKLSTKD
jgi:hypothetical protein